jgi:hypothetical protein
MFGLTDQTRVFLKTGVTDGRLGIDGLRGLVSNVLQQDVLAGYVFAFCNGRHNRVRCLLFDGYGSVGNMGTGRVGHVGVPQECGDWAVPLPIITALPRT